MKWLLIGAAILHFGFMMFELFPWSAPVLLQIVTKKQLKDEPFTVRQQKVVATVVHNAGIYNGILAGGLLWAAYAGLAATDVARVMLIGAAVAGVFGTATLKSPVTALQAAVGIVGAIFV
jgi:uncharacterized membrane protein